MYLLLGLLQVGERPRGHCDMRSSRIITDKCHKNEASLLVKCIH